MRPTNDPQRPRQNPVKPANDEPTQLDQTLADGTIVPEPDAQDATLNSESHPAENEPEYWDESGTLVDPTLTNPSAFDDRSNEHQTIVDTGLAAPSGRRSQPDLDDDGATLNDATMADEPSPTRVRAPQLRSSQKPGVSDSDATINGDDEVESDAGATLADPQLAAGARPADRREEKRRDDDDESGSIESATLSDQFGIQEVSADRTMADDGSVPEPDTDHTAALPEPEATVHGDFKPPKVDHDGTVIESFNADSDGTRIESSEADDDRTQMETDVGEDGVASRDQTIIEGSAGQSADPHATLISKDDQSSRSSKSKAPPKKKGVHETADRWENQQRYGLVNNFARGGLGQIWLANDVRLRREVAYKEMLPNALKNRPAIERFLEEAQITGQLEHPCIMPIYDIGYQPNGAPFYAMKFVRGDTLEKAISAFHELPKDHPEREIRFRKLLKNFLDCCNALGFAHDRGVLHRDLKPLNIMVGPFGETIVLDWGLAKIIDSETQTGQAPVTTNTEELGPDGATIIQSVNSVQSLGQTQSGASVSGASQTGTVSATKRSVVTDVRSVGSQTMMGSVMGTPSYMPPEQALGKLDQLDARSDIYSLGGILYKLLTNQQPIEKGRMKEVLDRVVNNVIVPPRQHDPSIPAPLAAVALKALAKERDDRYPTALALAADVEAWMADEPVSCFPDPPLVRARRWAKRHRTAVMSSGVGVAVLTLVFIASSIMHRAELNRLREVARVAMLQADDASQTGNFSAARQTLTEAAGQVATQSDLSDLRESLASRIDLIETRRLDKLRRQAESKLEAANAEVESGKYELARTSLAELKTLLVSESALKEIAQSVDRQIAVVEAALRERAEIAATAAKFTQFEKLVDATRALGSLLELDNIDDDAKQALLSGKQALALFNLDQAQPLAQPPKHFERELQWVKQFQEKRVQSPLEVLRENTFEVLLTLAEMEVSLARNDDEPTRHAALDRALVWIAKAERLGLTSQAVLGRKAVYLSQRGRSEEAAEFMQKALKLKAQTSLDHFLLGEEKRKQAQYADALVFYLKAQQIDPNHYWVQHCTGLCYLQLNQPVAATSCFSTCIAMRPSYVWPRMLRGVCYSKLNDFESAHGEFDLAVKLDANLYNLFVNRGAVFFFQKRYPEALKDFETAATLKPDAASPHINIAAVHRAEAERLIAEPLPFDDKLTPVQLEQRQAARDADASKRLNLALAALAEAGDITRAPSHPGVYQMRAEIFQRQQNNALALENYEKHLRFERDANKLASSHKAIGRIHSFKGDHKQALESYLTASKLAPKQAETVYLLGETSLQLGNNEVAIQNYQQFQRMTNIAIESVVSHPEQLYQGIATAYDKLGRKHDAIEYYTLSLIFNRDQAVPLTKRGWSYLTHANVLAKRDFEDATKANPENADSWIGLGYVSVSLNQVPDAIKHADTGVKFAREQVKQPAVGAVGWRLFHNAATVYARSLQAIAQKPKQTEDEAKLIPELLAKTIATIREAQQVASLERDPAKPELQMMLLSLQHESDFNVIRRTEPFTQLVNEFLAPRK